MAEKSIIAWTDNTFNPWMGCHKVSAGCKHCYAETLTKGRMGRPGLWGANGTRARTGKAIWAKPYAWNRQAEKEQRRIRVFVASLADVFETHPAQQAEMQEWRDDLWALIRECPNLDFQLLTKRPENIESMLPADWAGGYDNVWLGTSIEDNRVAYRGEILTQIPAIVHFVSYEPAIGSLDDLDLLHIEWLIVGGESGPGHRKLDLGWCYDIKARCAAHKTAFFFKQDSGHRTEMRIDALGEIFRDYPLDARIMDPATAEQVTPWRPYASMDRGRPAYEVDVKAQTEDEVMA
jgi:protein gp37